MENTWCGLLGHANSSMMQSNICKISETQFNIPLRTRVSDGLISMVTIPVVNRGNLHRRSDRCFALKVIRWGEERSARWWRQQPSASRKLRRAPPLQSRCWRVRVLSSSEAQWQPPKTHWTHIYVSVSQREPRQASIAPWCRNWRSSFTSGIIWTSSTCWEPVQSLGVRHHIRL